jgi:hypothetical protein
VIVVTFVLFLSQSASAAPLLPPWSGQSGTTHQQWTFDDADNPAAPEDYRNDYGMPVANITPGDFASGWVDTVPGFGTQTGIWDLGDGGTIVLEIGNQPVASPYKEIWVQVTYFEDTLIPSPTVDVPGAVLLAEQTEIILVEATQPFGDWLMQKTVWQITPNPASEQIVITALQGATAMVDQVTVDTICIPEPASMVMLILGASTLMLRRNP